MCLLSTGNFYPYPDSTFNYLTDNLSVINYPDSLGGFQPFSLYFNLGGAYYGLPNNPNYGLGRFKVHRAIRCSGQTSPGPLQRRGGVMQITYISAWEKLFINAQNLKGRI
ncbi:MAG: hypothetical protein IPP29_13205 [Bacteroidetes bacterium]|nr:hypothetical protein [Bacteroidota bacterium]